MGDLEIANECWKSAIPVQVKLAETDLSSMEQPPTLYFLVPRHSYLHSTVPQGMRLLQHLLPPGELTPWFEHGRLPLKWNVPAGVLYDLLSPREGEAPWSLTIHFRSYPSAQLAPYEGEACLRSSYLNSLKEAAFIARGSAMRVMEMSGGAQQDLWAAVLAGVRPAYVQILESLQMTPAPRGGRPPCIPLRLFVRRGPRSAYLTSYEDIAFTSRPAEAEATNGRLISLQEALVPLVAECLQSTSDGGSREQPENCGDGAGARQPAAQQRQQQHDQEEGGRLSPRLATVSSSDREGEQGASRSPARGSRAGSEEKPQQANDARSDGLIMTAATWEVLVAGVRPPLDAPLAWLHTHLHAADFFLYVVVHLLS